MSVYTESTVTVLAIDLREGDMLATPEGRVVAQVRGLVKRWSGSERRGTVGFDMVGLDGRVGLICEAAPDTALFDVVGSEER